jgi:hypothetical protein
MYMYASPLEAAANHCVNDLATGLLPKCESKFWYVRHIFFYVIQEY